MLRLLSPILLWAFIKANRNALKRLFIIAFAYLLALVVYIDFETVFFEGEIVIFKLIKWLMVMTAIAHIIFVFKTFKSQARSKQVNRKDLSAPLLTKSQKIIRKYKKAGNDGT